MPYSAVLSNTAREYLVVGVGDKLKVSSVCKAFVNHSFKAFLILLRDSGAIPRYVAI